jgi:hypothetical protein
VDGVRIGRRLVGTIALQPCEILERRTEQSALLLRDVLGTIRLEPSRGDVGRPYYLAQTDIDCIALLEPPVPYPSRWPWWTPPTGRYTSRSLPRPFSFASWASAIEFIAKRLGVSDKTVPKAIRWLHGHAP